MLHEHVVHVNACERSERLKLNENSSAAKGSTYIFRLFPHWKDKKRNTIQNFYPIGPTKEKKWNTGADVSLKNDIKAYQRDIQHLDCILTRVHVLVKKRTPKDNSLD